MKRASVGFVVLAMATSAMALPEGQGWILWDVGTGLSTGISTDGAAIAYNSAGTSYIYSKTNGSTAVGTGNNVGIAKVGNDYAIAYTSSASGTYKSYLWKGGLDGVGTTTADPYSGASYAFTARGIGGDATQAYVAGSYTASGKGGVAARWKAPAGSVSAYGQPGNFNSDLYYFYGASNNGMYCGWGRLSSTGTASNKSQAMVLDGSLVSLKNPWGAPSAAYYSNAYNLSGDGQTVVGYAGLSDNSTALATYWNRSELGTYTTNTTANLIPLLSGYEKSYAMKTDQDGSVIGGYTVKPAGTWGVDRRTIFLYDKATGTETDLRQLLIGKGVDMSGWGLMDITGISGDGRILTGTMLSANDTYWTTGSVNTPYHTWMVDLDGTIVPEPASALFLVLGGLVLVRRRR